MSNSSDACDMIEFGDDSDNDIEFRHPPSIDGSIDTYTSSKSDTPLDAFSELVDVVNKLSNVAQPSDGVASGKDDYLIELVEAFDCTEDSLIVVCSNGKAILKKCVIDQFARANAAWKGRSCITIDNVKQETLESIINCLVSKEDPFARHPLMQVVIVAEKLELAKLLGECTAKVTLTNDSLEIIKMLQIAQVINNGAVQQLAYECLSKHKRTVLSSEAWLNFVQKDPRLAVAIMKSAFDFASEKKPQSLHGRS